MKLEDHVFCNSGVFVSIRAVVLPIESWNAVSRRDHNKINCLPNKEKQVIRIVFLGLTVKIIYVFGGILKNISKTT